MVSVFLQRGSILAVVEMSVCLSDRPSVRPSVCLLRYGIQSKRRNLGSRTFHHQVGQGFWFSVGNFIHKFEWDHCAKRFNDRGIAKIGQKVVLTPKRCKLGPRLLLITIRKSYTRFRLGSKSMTLDDLEQSLQWTAQLPRCFLCNSWASCLVSYTEKILVGNKWKNPGFWQKYPETQTTPKKPRSSGKTQLWQHW